MEAADAIQALLDCDPEVGAPVDDWVTKTFLLPEEESEPLLPRRKRRLANGDESIAAALTALPVPPLATPTPAAAPPTCNSTVTESPPEEDVAPPLRWASLLECPPISPPSHDASRRSSPTADDEGVSTAIGARGGGAAAGGGDGDISRGGRGTSGSDTRCVAASSPVCCVPPVGTAREPALTALTGRELCQRLRVAQRERDAKELSEWLRQVQHGGSSPLDDRILPMVSPTRRASQRAAARVSRGGAIRPAGSFAGRSSVAGRL